MVRVTTVEKNTDFYNTDISGTQHTSYRSN